MAARHILAPYWIVRNTSGNDGWTVLLVESIRRAGEFRVAYTRENWPRWKISCAVGLSMGDTVLNEARSYRNYTAANPAFIHRVTVFAKTTASKRRRSASARVRLEWQQE